MKLERFSNFSEQKISKIRIITSMLLFTLWLQSASILTKAITGLLLNTYFKLKSFPIANNIQDIYDDKELAIFATDFWFEKFILPKLDKNEQNDFSRRRINHLFNFLQEMIMGKTVLLANSYVRKHVMDRYRKWDHMLTVGQEKRGLAFGLLCVRKNLTITNILNFL